jgi:hypothetical protein
MSSWSEHAREVETRAGSRCEYCRMHQALQGATFHVEHILNHSRRVLIRQAETLFGLFPP